MPSQEMTTDEMVAVIYDRSERLERALFGNGQPGLTGRVDKIEERINMNTRAGWYGGIGGGAAGSGVLGLILLLLDKFGVQVG